MDKKFEDKFAAMDKQIEGKFAAMDKQIEDKFVAIQENQDWLFEINTRSVIARRTSFDFAKCCEVRSFKDFSNYFYDLCDDDTKGFLFDRNFDLENILKSKSYNFINLKKFSIE